MSNHSEDDQKVAAQTDSTFDDDDQTPIDEASRKTGTPIETGAKPTAKPEAGEGSSVVVGSPNQGTESR